MIIFFVDILTSEIININKSLLTVKELLNSINYEYNTIFLDKFWQGVDDNMLKYIDDNMLKYIGYKAIELKKEKQNYYDLIKRNYYVNINFKYVNLSEFKYFLSTHEVHIDNYEYYYNKIYIQ